MGDIYNLKSKVVLYSGSTVWHFAVIKKDVAKEIKEKHGQNRRGFGSIRVEVTIGETTWLTSIFPSKASETYVLPLKAAVRRKEDINDGETVAFSIKIV